ncbi:N-acetylmuramoyl-L-alanine amidase [Paenibacillus sp. GYB004]|uniref:N-acetylmuramoyl-L-alanine amidase family protein n=1 Tax=Paenibacillus sp. GYB004 TaxID=2994393 RepID=UPI002F968C1F
MRTGRIKRMLAFSLLLSLSLPVQAVLASAAGAAASGAPVICIDPGHQLRGNNQLESVGPGSSEKKPKVSSGTRGVATGKPEYVLTLEVSKRIRDKLEALGYQVVMTRDTHEVDISNKERAELANGAGADLFLRIHADGSTSPKAKGASVLYPAISVAVSNEQYSLSKTAAEIVLTDLVAATQANSRGTVARDDLSGFNWSEVPNILIEMGFMSNAEEDRLLATEAYQEKMAEGIAAGVHRYMTDAAGKSPWDPQPFEQPLTLLGDTDLYDRVSGRLTPVGAYLGPQTVSARERAGDWYRIDTWLGSNWVRVPKAVTGQIESETQLVELPAVTTFRRLPFADEPAMGELSPQTVQAFGSWNGWLHIRTWLGDAWVQAP